MILLELTEKEFKLIRSSILNSRKSSHLSYEKDGFEADKMNTEAHDSLLSKLAESVLGRKEILLKFKDLFDIKALAVNHFQMLSLPMSLSNRELEEKDLRNIALIKAILLWLSGQNLLKNLITFDITDNSCQYESIEE